MVWSTWTGDIAARIGRHRCHPVGIAKGISAANIGEANRQKQMDRRERHDENWTNRLLRDMQKDTMREEQEDLMKFIHSGGGESVPRSSRRSRPSSTRLDAATLSLVKAMYKEVKRLVREVIRLRQLDSSRKRRKAARKKFNE
jgi:hypothetical protein